MNILVLALQNLRTYVYMRIHTYRYEGHFGEMGSGMFKTDVANTSEIL